MVRILCGLPVELVPHWGQQKAKDNYEISMTGIGKQFLAVHYLSARTEAICIILFMFSRWDLACFQTGVIFRLPDDSGRLDFRLTLSRTAVSNVRAPELIEN